MATTHILVARLTGQAWMRDAEGNLVALRPGMRIPVGAEIVTEDGAVVELAGDAGQPILIGGGRDVALGPEIVQPHVDPLLNAASPDLTPEQAEVLAALRQGADPLEELDPTAAVLQGGSSSEGGSFTRVAAIIETVRPLALEYPRAGLDYPDMLQTGAPGAGVAGAAAPDGAAMPPVAGPGSPAGDGDTGTAPGTSPGTGGGGGDTANPVDPAVPGDPSAPVDPAPVIPNPPVRPPLPEYVNSPPVAQRDEATTEENTVLAGNVIAGAGAGEGQDSDPDGDRLAVVRITNANGDTVEAGAPISGDSGGSFVIHPDGSYSFDPGTDFDDLAEGETRVTEVTYTISDGNGGTAVAKLVITVSGTNDAPIAVADTNTVSESGVAVGGNDEFKGIDAVTGKLLDNDSDVDGRAPLVVTGGAAGTDDSAGLSAPGTKLVGAYGSLVLQSDGTYTYTLDNAAKNVQQLAVGQSATDVFTYQIVDDKGATSTATLAITVVGTNDRPMIQGAETAALGAVAEQGHTDSDAVATVSGKLEADDVDAGATLSWSLRSEGAGETAPTLSGAYGSITIDPLTGQWTYTLDNASAATQALAEGQAATEVFVGRVTDEHGAWHERAIEITVTGSNDAPVAQADTDTVTESGVEKGGNTAFDGKSKATGNVLDNDSDVDAGAVLRVTGFVAGTEASASLTAPGAEISGEYGTLVLGADGSYVYTLKNDDPKVQALKADQSAEDVFTYQVTDEKGATHTATLRISIAGTNDAPVAQADTDTVSESGVEKGGNTAFDGKSKATGNVLDNDSDVDTGAVLRVTGFVAGTDASASLTKPGAEISGEYGTLVLGADGSYVYTLKNDDPKVQALKADQSAEDVFTYRVTDEKGATHTATLRISITGTNDAPVIEDAQTAVVAAVTEQGVGNPGQSNVISGTLKASDADADATQSWSLRSGGTDVVELEGTYGTIAINTSTGTWTYTLDNARPATQDLADGETKQEVRFLARVTDEHGAWHERAIEITVTGSNDAPVAQADTDTVTESGVEKGGNTAFDGKSRATGNVLDNDSDVDTGAVRTVKGGFVGTEESTGMSAPGTELVGAYGSLVLQSNGTYTYTLNNGATNVQELAAGHSAYDVFSYQIVDDKGATSTATLTITVTGTNDRPVIKDAGTAIQSTVTEQGHTNPAALAAVSGKLEATDVDVGATQTWSLRSGDANVVEVNGTYGRITIDQSTGTWTYTLDNTRTATQALADGVTQPEVTFVARVTDEHGAWHEREIKITVTGSNDAPVAQADTDTVTESGVEKGGNTAFDGKSKATGNVLDNDSDVDTGAVLRVTGFVAGTDASASLTAPGAEISGEYGTLVLGADGSYVYTLKNDDPKVQALKADQSAEDVFTYRVTDEKGATHTATLRISITGTNDAPVIEDAQTAVVAAVTEQGVGNPGQSNVISGTLEASDADADATQSWSLRSGGTDVVELEGTYGTIAINTSTGTWTYTLDNARPATQELADGETKQEVRFLARVTDEHGAWHERAIEITVTGSNDAPVAQADTDTVTESGVEKGGNTAFDGKSRATGNVLDNDSDVDTGAVLRVTGFVAGTDASASLTAPGAEISGEYGTLVLGADGSYVYTLKNDDPKVQALKADQSAEDVFSYQVTDEKGATHTATLCISITGTNDRPTITDALIPVEVSLTERGHSNPKQGETVKGKLEASDVDVGATRLWSLYDGNEGLTKIIGTYGDITINPDTGDWTYKLDNKRAATQALAEGETQQEVTFVARVTDEHGAWHERKIYVTVTGSNDAPTAKANTGTVSEAGVRSGGNNHFGGTNAATGNVLDGDSDVDAGDTIKLVSVRLGDVQHVFAPDQPEATLVGIYGTLVIKSDGSYIYTLDNSATEVDQLAAGTEAKEVFDYVIQDSHAVSASSKLTITVKGTNDRPIIDGTATQRVGTVTEAGHEEPGNAEVAGRLAANDVDLGDVLTWKLVTGTSAKPVFSDTLNGEYGSIQVIKDPATGEWSWKYTLDDSRESTRGLTNNDIRTETFKVRVTDKPGAWVEETITITIQGTNDKPIARADVARFDELDPGHSFTGNVITNDDNSSEGALKVVGFTVAGMEDSGSPIPYAPGDTVEIAGVGSFTMTDTGDYTFTPLDNYSGPVPVITYTIKEPDGNGEAGFSDSSTLTLIINPVADKPVVSADAAQVNTKEDTAIALGFNAPVVMDAIDHNGALTGDNTERLGAISLEGLPVAAVLRDARGNVLFTVKETGAITIVLSDGAHIAGATGDLTLTKEQFESLQVLPPAESGGNFTVTMSVTSYEVNDDGSRIPNIGGATSKTSVLVDVLAVTDEVDLELVDRDADGSAAVHAILEDSLFNLKDVLAVRFPSTDAVSGGQVDNGKADIDGSETHRFVISGLPEGTRVGDQVVGADGRVEIQAPGLSTSATGLPDMNIRLPEHFSGKLPVTITLIAQDTDKDSAGEILPEQDSVRLELVVKPQAGDVAIEDTDESVSEDGKVNFLNGIRVSDTGVSAGTEVITKVEFGVPAGWTVIPPSSGTGWTLSEEGGKQVIEFHDDLTQADREAILDAFQIQPPPHSSADEDITVTVHTRDTNPETGTDEATTDVTIRVEVTPVAEKVGVDSDGDGKPDLTITGGKVYGTHATEDEWFHLSQDGFALNDGWANSDANEKTSALLTPTQPGGNALIGSQFTYTDSTGTTHTVTFKGDPIEIPMEALNTVQFKAPPNMSGDVQIQIQAKTVDFDHDTGEATGPSISGLAKLDIKVAPAADLVTLGVSGATGFEDNKNTDYAAWTGVALSVRPSSSDASETFTVKIGNIPEGSTLYYDGVALTPASTEDGKLVFQIDGFDQAKSLSYKPPMHDSGKYDLHVEARSVDAATSTGVDTAVSGWQKQTLPVHIKGWADKVDVTLNETGHFEEDALAGADKNCIALSELVSGVVRQDASETLTLKLTGLDPQFRVEGGTAIGGSGAGREWVFTAEDLANVRIIVPKHYSGEVTAKLVPVTTEADGNSWTAKGADVIDLRAEIIPTVDATVGEASALTEDRYSDVRFVLNRHGDANETLEAVLIRADDVEGADKAFALFLKGSTAATAPMTLAEAAAANVSGIEILEQDGQRFYRLTADQYNNVQALAQANVAGVGGISFAVKYEIRDASNDGKVDAVTVVREDVHTLNVNAVTDEIDLMLDGFKYPDGSPMQSDAGSAGKPSITLTQPGEFSVGMTLRQLGTQKGGQAEGHNTADVDGSEQFTQVVIRGVPNGVLVEGLRIVDANGNSQTLVDAGDVIYLGDDRWVISIPAADYPSFTSAELKAEVVFKAGDYLVHGTEDLQPVNKEITIQVTTQDTNADNKETDSASFELNTDWTDGGGTGGDPSHGVQTVDVTWSMKEFRPTEDTPFELSKLLAAQFVFAGGQPAQADPLNPGAPSPAPEASFTLLLTPIGGATITSMDPSIEVMELEVDGEKLLLVRGSGDQAFLDSVLDKLLVTPPAHLNENWSDNLQFDVKLAAYVGSGSRGEKDQQVSKGDLIPVSDAPGVDIGFVALDAGGNPDGAPKEGSDIGITLSVRNPADRGATQLGDTVYLKLSTEMNGQLLDAEGKPLQAESVAGVAGLDAGTYYKIPLPEGYQLGDPLTLTFALDDGSRFMADSLSVDAWVQSRERDAESTDWLMGHSAATGQVQTIDNELDLDLGMPGGGTGEPGDPDANVIRGDENRSGNDLITIRLGGGVQDKHNAEQVFVALLKGVPNDFLVYVSDTGAPGSFALARNAGESSGVNTWNLPLTMVGGDRNIPEYIAVLPPKNWSGTLEDLQLFVSSGERNTDTPRETTVDFDLEVIARADGIELINPAPAFGVEGDVIQLNLNIALKDGVATEGIIGRQGAVADGSTESVSLTLKGLGELAAFYLPAADGTSERVMATYDRATDTYTLVGLSQEEVRQLGFVQAAGAAATEVEVQAWTVESVGGDRSVATEPRKFDVTINRPDPTAGDDRLLYGGLVTDGGAGEDTIWLRAGDDIDFGAGTINVSNVERIDLLGGSHSLFGIGIDDVIAMVGPSGTLTIDGDDDDVIRFEPPAADGGNGWYLDRELTSLKDDGYEYYRYLVEYEEVIIPVEVEPVAGTEPIPESPAPGDAALENPEHPDSSEGEGAPADPPAPITVHKPVVHDATVRVKAGAPVDEDTLLSEPPVVPPELLDPDGADDSEPSTQGDGAQASAQDIEEPDDVPVAAATIDPDDDTLQIDDVFAEDGGDDGALAEALTRLGDADVNEADGEDEHEDSVATDTTDAQGKAGAEVTSGKGSSSTKAEEPSPYSNDPDAAALDSLSSINDMISSMAASTQNPD